MGEKPTDSANILPVRESLGRLKRLQRFIGRVSSRGANTVVGSMGSMRPNLAVTSHNAIDAPTDPSTDPAAMEAFLAAPPVAEVDFGNMPMSLGTDHIKTLEGIDASLPTTPGARVNMNAPAFDPAVYNPDMPRRRVDVDPDLAGHVPGWMRELQQDAARSASDPHGEELRNEALGMMNTPPAPGSVDPQGRLLVHN